MLSQATARLTVPPASAVGRFGSFKPPTEGAQPVRQHLVIGDEMQHLLRRRQMLRSMTPEQAYHAIDWVHADLTFFESVALAKETGKLMVPNDVIDRILTKTDYQMPIVRTGTIIMYGAPDTPFSDKINYGGIEFSMPTRFRGKTKCALVVVYPDFDLISLVGGGYRLVVPDETQLHLIEQFPKRDGRYWQDCEFGIPYGAMKKSSQYTRDLWRMDSSYIGFVARGVYGFGDVNRCDVGARGDQSGVSGVALI